LLVEEARTNLILWSEEFDNSYWQKQNLTVTQNSAVSPDGKINADKIIPDLNSTSPRDIRTSTFSVTSGLFYTASIFAKKGEIDIISIQLNGQIWEDSNINQRPRVRVNLTDGSIVENNFNSGVSVMIYPGGYFKISLTALCSVTANTQIEISFPNFTGDGTSGLYIWGAQLEVGAFPTSYIPTTASTVTRTVDSVSMTGSNFSSWYRQDEGTLSTRYKTIGDKGNQMICQIRSISGDNRVEIRAQAGTGTSQFRIEVINNGATQQQEFSIFPSGYTVNNFHKITLGYKENNFASTINGTLYTDNTGVVGSCNIMTIGAANYGFSGDLNGHISQLTYYPSRLTNTQLITLTK
jgi:hypothetical protein